MVDGYDVTAYKNSKQAFELEDSYYSFKEEFIIARVKGLEENGTILIGGDEDFWDGAKEGNGRILKEKVLIYCEFFDEKTCGAIQCLKV